MGVTLEEITAELLAGPLQEFTSRRTAQARELKAAGQAALAAEVNSLRKPPVALWAANQVARRQGAALDRLRRAAEDVVRSQQAAVGGRSGAGAGLRRATVELQRELEQAAGAARAALREDGHAADEATARRLQEILRVAAVSGGEQWDRLRQGALLTEPRAGEELLGAAFGTATGAPPLRPSTARGRESAQAERRIQAQAAVRTARADADRAQRAAETARRLRAQADAMAADARRAEERARAAERELKEASARARASQAAARRLS